MLTQLRSGRTTSNLPPLLFMVAKVAPLSEASARSSSAAAFITARLAKLSAL